MFLSCFPFHLLINILQCYSVCIHSDCFDVTNSLLVFDEEPAQPVSSLVSLFDVAFINRIVVSLCNGYLSVATNSFFPISFHLTRLIFRTLVTHQYLPPPDGFLFSSLQ